MAYGRLMRSKSSCSVAIRRETVRSPTNRRVTNAADLIRAVARIHGLPDGPLSEPGWPGVVNEVNIVGSGTDRYVIRIPRGRGRAEEFAVEAWCAERAREHAVPTADVVGVGVVNAVAYSVQRFVAGASGETVRSAEVWRTLGRYARIINAIPLDDAPDALFSRFGRDLPAAWQGGCPEFRGTSVAAR
jgi:aminoglycoside phosphotransferase (APT) family kinase protein